VLELVTARPGISQREIVLELGIERDTVGYHLRGLVSEGHLAAERRGRFMVYRSRKLT
jgi:predicted transcriptional regulator